MSELIFTETTPVHLYDRMDAESLHPERISALNKLTQLQNQGVARIDRLGNLFEVVKGRTTSSGQFPCIEMDDVETDFGLLTSLRRVSVAEAGTSNVACKGGQILFSGLRPYLNKVTFLPPNLGEAICSGEFYVLVPRESGLPLGTIWIILRSRLILHQSSHLIGGAMRPRIDDDTIADLSIPIPKNQKMVARINQIVLRAVKRYSQALENSRTAEDSFMDATGLEPAPKVPEPFFETATQQLDAPRPFFRMDPLFFHPSYYRDLKASLEKWESQKNGKVTKLAKLSIPKGIARPKGRVTNEMGTTARLGVENITGKGVLWDCNHVEVAPQQGKAFLRKNDLLISATGTGSTGRVEIYLGKTPTITDGHIAVVRLNKTIKHFYILSYLRSTYGQRQLRRMERGSSGQIEMYPDDIENLLVPVPRKTTTIMNAQRVSKQSIEAMEAAKSKLAEAREQIGSLFSG